MYFDFSLIEESIVLVMMKIFTKKKINMKFLILKVKKIYRKYKVSININDFI